MYRPSHTKYVDVPYHHKCAYDAMVVGLTKIYLFIGYPSTNSFCINNTFTTLLDRCFMRCFLSFNFNQVNSYNQYKYEIIYVI